MRNKIIIKAFSLFVCFLLVTAASCISPLTANAVSDKWDGSVDISWYDESVNEYYISSPAQLAGAAALTNGMTDICVDDSMIIGDKSLISSTVVKDVTITGAAGGNVTADVYTSKIDFAGKTLYITCDLDMGGERDSNGNWFGPNWTPIGGKYSMDKDSMGEDTLLLDTRFNGVLDGQGHKIFNLYCDRYSKKGFAYSQCVGLVGYIGEGEFEDGYCPCVRNVSLYGNIYARRMTGGIVGRVGETNNGVIIENCSNHADVFSTDSKGIGGVVATGWGKGVIRNCYNSGSVSTIYACPAGGICGSNGGMNIYNCYNAGQISSDGNARDRAIGGHDKGSYVVDNCYYLEGSASDGGYYTADSEDITVNVKALKSDYMKSDSFIKNLNTSGDVFVKDSDNINNGYPILYFEQKGYENKAFKIDISPDITCGNISVSDTAVSYGGTVDFHANPEPGYILDFFAVNGEKITTDFYTVTSDITVSAVFRPLKNAVVTINADSAASVSVTKSGTVKDGDKYKRVEQYGVRSGDTVYEGDVLYISATVDTHAATADTSSEYNGKFTCTATNARQITPFEFEITGDGDTVISVAAETRLKQWITLQDSSWYSKDKDSFSISTAAQLAGLAYIVNSGTDTFEGKTVTLENDISMKNTDGTNAIRYFTPIGDNPSHTFSGTFDGNGCTVTDFSGLYESSGGGLFGYVKNGVIKDLTAQGEAQADKSICGAIAGNIDGGKIMNCVSNVSVNAAAYAAGIVGKAVGCEITGCVNNGSVTSSGNYAAGLAAKCGQGTIIRDCVNNGMVKSESNTAGICAEYNSFETIARCANNAKLISTADGKSDSMATGGIAAVVMCASNIDNCCNTGDIDCTGPTVGGIIGKALSGSVNITNCYNTGSIDNICTSTSYCGGIAGILTDSSSIVSCYSNGDINAQNDSASISDSYAKVSGSAELKNFVDRETYISSDKAEIIKILGSCFALSDDGEDIVLLWQTKNAAEVTLRGDADGSGTVDMLDVVTIQKYIARLIDSASLNIANCDVNNDGLVNLNDVVDIQKFIAGLITL